MIFTDFVCNWTFEYQTSKHNYHCCSSCTFSRTVIVNAGLFPIQTFTSLVIHFPCSLDKKPKQKSSICCHKMTLKAMRSQEHWPVNHNQQTRLLGILSKGLCTDWLVCIAFGIFWNLIGSDQLSLFFLNRRVCL